MIPNNWKKILSERGYIPSHFALSMGINKGTFSQVCSGYRLLDFDTFRDCCLELRCHYDEIYPANVLSMVYNIKRERKATTPKRTAKRVPMTEEVAAQVDALVEAGVYKNRAAAVEEIVKQYLAGG